MGPIGYKASLEEMERNLNNCEFVVTYLEGKNEGISFVFPENLDYYLNELLPSRGWELLAVTNLNKAEIPSYAKQITDRMALEKYGYIHKENDNDLIH